MNDLARFEIDRGPWVSVLRVIGEVDMSNASELSAALETALPNGQSMLVVDLTETTYLDSAGVQLLFLLVERLQSRRQELHVVVPADAPIRAVLELTGLSQIARLEDGPGHEG